MIRECLSEIISFRFLYRFFTITDFHWVCGDGLLKKFASDITVTAMLLLPEIFKSFTKLVMALFFRKE